MQNLNEVVDELLEYFEMHNNDWPVLSVWSNGAFHQGVINDELYSILISLKEIREVHDESEN